MEYLLYRLAVGLLGPVSDEISFSRADNGARHGNANQKGNEWDPCLGTGHLELGT